MKNVGNNSESGEEREVAEMEVNGEKIEKRRKSFLLRNETVGKEVSRKQRIVKKMEGSNGKARMRGRKFFF